MRIRKIKPNYNLVLTLNNSSYTLTHGRYMKGNLMKTNITLPRARSEGLVVENLEDEVLVYDLSRQKSHCLNQTADLIWKHCDGQTSLAQMARIINKETNEPITEQAIWLGLKQLAGAHLLQERLNVPTHLANISRRKLIRRMGLTAMTLPLILTITAPTAKAQGSCLLRDQPCTANAQCCSGNCRGNGLCA